jgi:hypothetical protein
MNNFKLEKISINMSNGWVIGCSILTCGMLTYAYLEGISNLYLIHMKRKNILELQQIESLNDLSEKIKKEEKIISYYWQHHNIVFILGITGVSIVAFRSKLVKS